MALKEIDIGCDGGGLVETGRDRLDTPYITTQPRQFYRGIDTGRLDRPSSLDALSVRRGMLPNALGGRMMNGEVFRVEETGFGLELCFCGGKREKLCCLEDPDANELRSVKNWSCGADLMRDVRDIYCVPVAPWGDDTVLFMDIGRKAQPSLVDIDKGARDRLMGDVSSILTSMREEHEVVYCGLNNSAGALSTGAGLMSVMWVHGCAFAVDEFEDSLSVNETLRIRNRSIWDEGISRIVGECVLGVLKSGILSRQYTSSAVGVDEMGLWMHIADFTPDDIKDIKFLELWRDMSLAMHWQIRGCHEMLFGSNLDDVIRFVRGAHFEGLPESVLMDDYRKFFKLNGNFSNDPRANILRRLVKQGLVRLGGGWTGAMRFDDSGLLITATPGFGKWSVGPVEAMGMRLRRPRRPVPREIMQEKEERYKKYLSNVLNV